MQVLLLLLFLSTGAVLGGKILAPDEDFYLLVTLKKGTTCDEFKSLFNFYLNVRSSGAISIPSNMWIHLDFSFGIWNENSEFFDSYASSEHGSNLIVFEMGHQVLIDWKQ